MPVTPEPPTATSAVPGPGWVPAGAGGAGAGFAGAGDSLPFFVDCPKGERGTVFFSGGFAGGCSTAGVGSTIFGSSSFGAAGGAGARGSARAGAGGAGERAVQQDREHDADAGSAIESCALGQDLSDAVVHSFLPDA